MSYQTIDLKTNGEGLYSITPQVQSTIKEAQIESGIVYLFCQHTSCALLVSEDYDPSAKSDLERFFKYLAPRDLSFIQHTLEGEDDSPSHMKSALLQPSLTIPIEKGELLMGQWQGIFLAEFRDQPKNRRLIVKWSHD